VIILGIDPGSQRTGFAVLESSKSGFEVREVGVIELVSGRHRPPLGSRLEKLFDEISALTERWNPRWIGFEKAVSFRNVASAFQLSEARGVVRLALHRGLDQAEERIVEISPTRIKKFATGSGAAEKSAVVKGVALRFPGLSRLTVEALPYDAYDALAIAYSAWLEKGRLARIHGLSGRA